jgi:hypothetical protein
MRVMGTEETGTLRALPKLLVFVLAACGGRYSGHSETDGTAGTSGSPLGMPVDEQPPRGGSSTGTGGSGAAIGGKSVGMGGSGIVGTAGSAIGYAGMATGSGGSNNPGYPIDPKSICVAYCSAVSAACPEVDAPLCSKQCFVEMAGQSNACRIWAWSQHDCITQAFRQTMSCSGAQYLASKLCGSDGSTPIACEDQPCDSDITFSSDDYCQSRRTCAGGESELRCVGTPGGPSCSCWVNGLRAADVMSTVDTARQACLEEELQWLCTKQLP